MPQNRETVFAFFADAHNLQTLTPPWLNFIVLTPRPIKIRQGTLIDYRLKIHGFPLRWQSEITVWEPPLRFVDEQRRGPYRYWLHTHTFEAQQGGTLCRDHVDYAVPGGALMNWLFVRRDVKRIFEYRQKVLDELFRKKRDIRFLGELKTLLLDRDYLAFLRPRFLVEELAMNSRLVSCFMLATAMTSSSPAAVIGTNVPAQPLTLERIRTLPESEWSVWRKYLERSEQKWKADHHFLRQELKTHGLKAETNAPSVRSFGGVPLNRSADWYTGNQARHIADVMLSFQTPAGGWSKHVNMTGRERVPGELFTSDENSHFLTSRDFDRPEDLHWSYVGTFDNGATTTQLRFLAKVVAALPAKQGAKYREAFLRGLNYIFSAQYPNGGWPQVWPLQGGYHDAITFNDGAMMHVMELLRDVSSGQHEFAFVPGKIRAEAASSMKRGVDCILATEIVVNGRRTVWCQQHDPLTLKPTSARNYEMPSECSAESAEIVLFLMQLPDPGPQIVQAVNAAVAWFEKTRIENVAFKFVGGIRRLVPSPGSGPLWARYYQIGTGRPIFGDRDKTIHDDLNEISAERRRGYAWFGSGPKLVLRRYETWKKEH